MNDAPTRPASAGAADVTVTLTAEDQLEIRGVPAAAAGLLSAVIRGISHGVLDAADLPPEPVAGDVEDAQAYVDGLNRRLVAIGLLAGGIENPGPLDEWRAAAACPDGCERDHQPVDEMDGIDGFHHDFGHTADIDLEVDTCNGDSSIAVTSSVWMPALFAKPGESMKDVESVPRVEIQDQHMSLVTLHAEEAQALADALHAAARTAFAGAGWAAR
jgi:hypothetical protein